MLDHIVSIQRYHVNVLRCSEEGYLCAQRRATCVPNRKVYNKMPHSHNHKN